MANCGACVHPQREGIDSALTAGTSVRQVAGTFGLLKSAINRHYVNHLGGRKETPASSVQFAALRPIESAVDVVDDLQRLRVEAFGLFEAAKNRRDWKSAERIFQQLVAVVDRFGEMHRVLGSKGVVVHVDRSTKVLNVLAEMDSDALRALLSGTDADAA